MEMPLDNLVAYLQLLGEGRLAEAVKRHDADGDQMIHAGEFIAALCTMRHSDTKVIETSLRRMVGFVSVDENGDGVLDEHEFLRYLTTQTHRRLTEQEARDIFKQFDKDGNGYIDYSELMALHDSGGIEKLNEYIKVTSWSKDIAKTLRDVPHRDIVGAIELHLQQGGEVRVLKTQNQLIVKLHSVSATGHNRMQLLECRWDPTTMLPVDEDPCFARAKLRKAEGKRRVLLPDTNGSRPAS